VSLLGKRRKSFQIREADFQEVRVIVDSKDSKKKAYASPTLTELTREQAIKLVADHKHCSEEEAAKVLDSLRKQKQSYASDQQRDRSA
jgi:hypothetical protein